MMTKIQKWGHGQGLRLSKALLSDADIAVGDSVDVAVHKDALVVTPVRRVRGGQELRPTSDPRWKSLAEDTHAPSARSVAHSNHSPNPTFFRSARKRGSSWSDRYVGSTPRYTANVPRTTPRDRKSVV